MTDTEQPKRISNEQLAKMVAQQLHGEACRVQLGGFNIRFGPDETPQTAGAWGTTYRLYIDTTDRNKWKVIPSWPFGADRHEYKPEQTLCITVSKNRGWLALVTDIKKKIMLVYTAAYPQMLDQARASFQVQDNRRKTFLSLAGIVDDYFTPQHEQECRKRPFKHGVRDIQVRSNGKIVELDLYGLSVDVAKEVLTLLAEKMPE